MTEPSVRFNDEMILATLDGRKTHHRLPIKLTTPVPANARPIYDALDCYKGEGWAFQYAETIQAVGTDLLTFNRIFPLPNKGRSPFGVPGDVLWVRECWQPQGWWKGELKRGTVWVMRRADASMSAEVVVPPALLPIRADCPEKWRPSTNMPRWASRIDLLVNRVWIEHVQDISEADAIAEGVDAIPSAPASLTHRTAFRGLWDSIYARGEFGWDENPRVFACEFELIKHEKARDA